MQMDNLDTIEHLEQVFNELENYSLTFQSIKVN